MPVLTVQSIFLLVNPSFFSIAISSLIVVPEVVSILPVIEAEAPALKAVAPFSGSILRPAAKRMLAVGLIKRKIAIVRKISSAGSWGRFSSAVGADHGDDLPLLHIQGNTLEGVDTAVIDIQITYLKHRHLRRPPFRGRPR